MGEVEEVDLRELVRRLVTKEVDGWAPQPGPQLAALLCPAYELLYGGAAGGGKTDYTLADHLRDALIYPFYKGVIFRRTYPELGEVVERARWFFPTGCPDVTERDGGHEWRFPLGGRLLLRHLNDYKAATAHKSAEYTKVSFEELTTFELRQYLYLHTRARSSKGVPISIRSTTNPGGIGHEFVFARWGPWLDPDYLDGRGNPLHAEPGEILWFIPGPKGEDIWVPAGTPNALSRTFIPAKLSDNKILVAADKTYEVRLDSQDPLTKEQLKNGNWLAKPSPKTYFNRIYAPIVESSPSLGRRARGWDRAATEQPTAEYPDPDFTASLKLSWVESEGLFYIEHASKERLGPGGVKQTIIATTKNDGISCEAVIPTDPSSAGILEAHDHMKSLKGYVVNTSSESGSKVVRAKVVSARWFPAPGSSYGLFRIVRGPWNEALLSELEMFPTKGIHDDLVDALSSAYRVLADGGGCEGEGSGTVDLDMLRAAGIHVSEEEDDDDERQSGRSSSGYRW